MVYQGRAWNEVVQVWHESTTSDGMGGVIPSWGDEPYLERYHCRIYKPESETTYEDEGRRDESLWSFIGQIREIRVGDKFVRADGTEMIVVAARFPKSDDGAHMLEGSLREIQPPEERPGED